MSTDLPKRPLPSPKGIRSFAIVVSQYNSEFTSALAEHAEREIVAIEPKSTVKRFEVPGAFEIPLIVDLLAEHHQYDAILALGVIIKGETAHADLIAASITEALLTTSLSYRVPVIHEVLLVADVAQARARCLDAALNRGVEAARAAFAASDVLQTIVST